MSKNNKKKGGRTVIAVSESGKNKKFLDFAISTSNTNSGVQQYGAGQSLKSRNRGRNVASYAGYPEMNEPDRCARPRARNAGPDPSLGVNLGTIGHVNQLTSELGVRMEPRVEVLQNADGSDFILAASGVGYETRSFNINAGLKTLKWASGVFGGFEKYEVLDLKFEFIPTVSGFNGAGEAGTVVLVFNYDALEGPPETMGDAMTYAPSVLTMPSVSALLEVDHRLCTPKEGKYVRSGPVAGDLKTYDAGTLHVCTEGIASTQEFGHILVYYTLKAIKARVNPPALSYFPSAATLQCQMSTFPVASPGVVVGGTPSTGSWVRSPGLASNAPPDLGSLPVGIDATSGDLHLPQGRYLADFQFGYAFNFTAASMRFYITPRTSGVQTWYYLTGAMVFGTTSAYPFSMQAVAPIVIDDPLGADVAVVVQTSAGTAGGSAGATLVIRHLTASLTY